MNKQSGSIPDNQSAIQHAPNDNIALGDATLFASKKRIISMRQEKEMKKINLLLVVAAIMVLGQPASADQQSSQEQSDSKQVQTMQKMHEEMQTMRQQMEQIHATDDADERKRLMQEHMQNMHKTMMMMSNMNQMMVQPDSGHQHGNAKCTDGTAECKQMNDMADRQGRMEMQMGMMRMMMQQMMEHNAVVESD